MGKFTNSFSSQDYQIIRQAVIALEKKHGIGDLRGNIIAVANELHPGRLLSDEMVDALMESCSKAQDIGKADLSQSPDELVSRGSADRRDLDPLALFPPKGDLAAGCLNRSLNWWQLR